jgi:hypothetical protein
MFGKSLSEVLFHDVRPWLLVVILSLSTSNIDDEFDIGTIVRINAVKLLDAYALQFFHGEIDSEAFRKAREPLFKEIVGAVIMDAYAFAFRNPQLRRSPTFLSAAHYLPTQLFQRFRRRTKSHSESPAAMPPKVAIQ